MNLEDLNRWLDELEKSPEEFSEDFDKKAMERVSAYIHSESGKNKNKYSRILKVASIIILFVGLMGVSGVAYAAISGRLSGVHTLTPELEEQLDKPIPIQSVEEPIPTQSVMDYPTVRSETYDPVNKYANTVILNESSFTEPLIYNIVTDYALTEKDDVSYSENEFVFDMNDVAVFTKEDGAAWQLNAGDEITIQIALDTDFAGSSQEGEPIEFAYIVDNKYIPFHLSRISNIPQTITFQAQDAGEYYFAITNATVTYLKITLLEIQ